MNCPRCGLSIEDALTTTCPRCGQSLAETAAESLPDSEVATDALYEAPALASADPPAAGAGVPPGERYDFSLGGPGTLPPPSTLDQSMLPGVPPTPPTSSPR